MSSPDIYDRYGELAAEANSLHERLEAACNEIIDLKRQLEEKSVVAKFWRSAAEHAIAGWNAEEDAHEETRMMARRAAHLAKAYIQLAVTDGLGFDDDETQDDLGQCEVWLEQLHEDHPVENASQALEQLGLRIEETETPRGS